MTLNALARQVQFIRAKAPKPVENYLNNPEWPRILAVMCRVLPAYPDAQADVEQAIAGMVAPMSWKQVEDRLYRAIKPYMDARVELAQALMALSKQREGG